MVDMFVLTPSPLDPKSMHLTLPADRLSVHEITLPPTPAHRLQAALAGALEEQLLDDPADLHFALAPDAATHMRAGRPFEVMVCEKAWLKDLLAKLAAEGHTIAAIQPESKERQFAHWNLAQFDFRPKPRLTTLLQGTASMAWQAPEWRWARVALVLAVVVNIVGLNLWAWRDRADLAAGRAQLGRILTQTYPETQVVVDAPLQMAKALARDKAQRGGQDSFGLEAQLASKAAPGKAYSQIDYANNEIKLSELNVSKP
jgi:type II secretory pathway component PulL